MQQVVTLKLTQAELDVLEWLMRKADVDSRSQAIRFALIQTAAREGIRPNEIMRMQEERSEHLPRRSRLIARLIGSRQSGRQGESAQKRV